MNKLTKSLVLNEYIKNWERTFPLSRSIEEREPSVKANEEVDTPHGSTEDLGAEALLIDMDLGCFFVLLRL